MKGKTLYSLDITAATDRIPMELYQVLLSPLIGTKLTELWAITLTGRGYEVPPSVLRDITIRESIVFSIGEYNEDTEIRYGAGQPMGALSSWASLALVHHLIVNFAAHRVGINNFSDYIILGDDIVIADSRVAESYLEVMKTFEVDINMNKSLISSLGVMEFAKRIWYNGEVFSGIPIRDAFIAWRFPAMFPNFVRGIARDVCILPASHSISELLSHYKVSMKPHMRLIQLPKVVLGSLIELLGPNSIYSNEYTPSLLLAISRSRLIDLYAWFQGKASHKASEIRQFEMLDRAYFSEWKRISSTPFSWISILNIWIRKIPVIPEVQSKFSFALIFFGVLIEAGGYCYKWWNWIKYNLSPQHDTMLYGNSRELFPQVMLTRVEDSSTSDYLLSSETYIDTKKILGKDIEIPIHFTLNRGIDYYTYSTSPLGPSNLNKVILDMNPDPLKIKEIYKGTRAKSKFIRSLGRVYLALPAC
jgi:hypothetical protein